MPFPSISINLLRTLDDKIKLSKLLADLAKKTNTGYAAYNDTATETTPITTVADAWTLITSDGLDPGTYTEKLPDGVTQLWDATNNKIDLDRLEVGDILAVELSVVLTPNVNNVSIDLRLNSNGIFTKEKAAGVLSSGSGVDYKITENFRFYIGGEAVKTADLTLEIKTSAACDIEVIGVLIEKL